MGFMGSVVFPWPPGYLGNAATSVASSVSLQRYGLEENYVFDPSVKHLRNTEIVTKFVWRMSPFSWALVVWGNSNDAERFHAETYNKTYPHILYL